MLHWPPLIHINNSIKMHLNAPQKIGDDNPPSPNTKNLLNLYHLGLFLFVHLVNHLQNEQFQKGVRSLRSPALHPLLDNYEPSMYTSFELLPHFHLPFEQGPYIPPLESLGLLPMPA